MVNNNTISGIYVITNKTNGKQYVGQSVNVYRRLKNHRYLLNSQKHKNFHLQKAWDKYGENSFEFKLIKACKP